MKRKTFYLAGGIEAYTDGGRPWRKRVLRALRNIGHDAIDPTSMEDDGFVERNRQLRRDKKYGEFYKIIKNLIDRDVALVDKSDAVLVYIPHLSHVFGTICEAFHAFNTGKPVYIIHKAPVHKTNSWLVAVAMQGKSAPEERIFVDIKSFVKHIKKNGVG